MGRTGINLENVRVRNKSAILSLLNSQDAMSRKDIAKVVGLTPAAVTLLCTEMMEEGMILEKGELQEEKRAGRKKVLVDINDAYKCESPAALFFCAVKERIRTRLSVIINKKGADWQWNG